MATCFITNPFDEVQQRYCEQQKSKQYYMEEMHRQMSNYPPQLGYGNQAAIAQAPQPKPDVPRKILLLLPKKGK